MVLMYASVPCHEQDTLVVKSWHETVTLYVVLVHNLPRVFVKLVKLYSVSVEAWWPYKVIGLLGGIFKCVPTPMVLMKFEMYKFLNKHMGRHTIIYDNYFLVYSWSTMCIILEIVWLVGVKFLTTAYLFPSTCCFSDHFIFHSCFYFEHTPKWLQVIINLGLDNIRETIL